MASRKSTLAQLDALAAEIERSNREAALALDRALAQIAKMRSQLDGMPSETLDDFGDRLLAREGTVPKGVLPDDF